MYEDPLLGGGKWDVSERTARRRSPAATRLRLDRTCAHVHRVGRTAQYAKGGHALLVLALKARGTEIPTVKIRAASDQCTFIMTRQSSNSRRYLSRRLLLRY
jgi:hypothetical protein